MLFEVSMQYHWGDAIAFVRAVKANRFGKRYHMMCRVIRIFFGAWFFRAGATGFYALFDGLVLEDAASYVFFLGPSLLLFALGIYLAFCGIANRAPLTEWRVGKSFSKYREKDAFYFTEEYYELSLDSSFHRINYSNIQAVMEDQEHYYLFIDKNTAHILKKTQFTKGDPNCFGAFIASKTNPQAH